MDSGCSNHRAKNKSIFINIHNSLKVKVQLGASQFSGTSTQILGAVCVTENTKRWTTSFCGAAKLKLSGLAPIFHFVFLGLPRSWSSVRQVLQRMIQRSLRWSSRWYMLYGRPEMEFAFSRRGSRLRWWCNERWIWQSRAKEVSRN